MRVCPEHGRIEVVEHVDRCPQCGLTALDDAAPEHREALDYARVTAASRGASAWQGSALVLVLAGLAATGIGASGGELPWWSFAVVVMVGLVLLASIVLVSHSDPSREGWSEPGHAIRLVTSTTAIAIAINLAFTVVKARASVEALSYAAGDPPWRLLTATLTHANARHLIGNLIALAMFGFVVDRRVGRRWMLAIFAVTAVTAALPQSMISPEPMIGFSGCVYGVFGAAFVLLPTRPMLLRIQTVVVPLPMWVWMIAIVTAFSVVDATDPARHVAWVAHLGGFFGGVLIGLPLRKVPPSPAFLEGESRRSATIASLARADGVDDLVPGAEAAEAASSNPEIAAFHRAARRKRVAVTLIGGGVLFVAGSVIATLATVMEAPPEAAGRRVNVIIISFAIAALGLAMMGSQLVRRRR